LTTGENIHFLIWKIFERIFKCLKIASTLLETKLVCPDKGKRKRIKEITSPFESNKIFDL
jgi:hypothetical protein